MNAREESTLLKTMDYISYFEKIIAAIIRLVWSFKI